MSTPTIPQYSFQLRGIDAPQFAILRNDADTTRDVQLNIQVRYDILNHLEFVRVTYRLEMHQDSNVFIILETMCAFALSDETKESVLDKVTRSVTLPEALTSHFGVLIMGAARGILFEKLRHTNYANLILPTIDISVVSKAITIEQPNG